MSASQASLPDDLLCIYSTLRKLGYIRQLESGQSEGTIQFATFPNIFLLKLLDERLGYLTEFAREICDDLFKQISGVKKVDKRYLDELDRESKQFNHIRQDFIRYPEFDEYFHRCVQHLHDFIIDLRWHEANIDPVTQSDSDYVARTLNSISLFLQFRKSLVGRAHSSGSAEKTSIKSVGQKQILIAKTPKSNLASSNKSPDEKIASPNLRRRVRFENSTSTTEDGSTAGVNQRKIAERDFNEAHSVLALDLLIHATDIFVRQLKAHFDGWSSSVESKLDSMLNHIFESNQRIRVKQLQLVVKRVKIYIDVHLTVLDYLNEIKTTYLIDKIFEVLCAKDSGRVLELYKKPKITLYVQRCLDIERVVLTGLMERCLQIYFGLLVCEINFPPVELDRSLPQRSREEAIKSHENVSHFISGWLEVDDILFGYARPRQTKDKCARAEVEKIANQIHRPKIVAKSSTLSLEGVYTSSSRILAQMDNLSEFLKAVISISSDRLRHRQETRYYFEFMALGLVEFFKIGADKLKYQLLSCKTAEESNLLTEKALRLDSGKEPTKLEAAIDYITVKVRCLKFIHIMTSTEKLIRAEAGRAQVGILASLDQLKKGLKQFTEICIGPKVVKELTERSVKQVEQ